MVSKIGLTSRTPSVPRQGLDLPRVTPENVFTAVLATLMTGVLLLALCGASDTGVAGTGLESAIVLLLYAGSLVLVFS